MRYFETSNIRLSFVRRDNFPLLTPDDRQSIKAHWAKMTATNSSLHNGQIFCCNGIVKESQRDITLGFNYSDYAIYKWARDNNLIIPGAYTAGVSTFIYDPEKDSYVFAMRSRQVGFDSNKYSATSGGVLEYHRFVLAPFFQKYVNRQALVENNEEIIARHRSRPKLIGAYLDKSTCKLEFAYLATATECQVANDENTFLTLVRRGEVRQFLNINKARMEQSSLKHLTHWASRFDQPNFK